MSLVKVRAQSPLGGVAGSIAAMIRKQEDVEVQAIGPSAVSTAIKAIAVANTFLQSDPTPVELACVPYFAEIEVEGEELTAIRLVIIPLAGAPTDAKAADPGNRNGSDSRQNPSR